MKILTRNALRDISSQPQLCSSLRRAKVRFLFRIFLFLGITAFKRFPCRFVDVALTLLNGGQPALFLNAKFMIPPHLDTPNGDRALLIGAQHEIFGNAPFGDTLIGTVKWCYLNDFKEHNKIIEVNVDKIWDYFQIWKIFSAVSYPGGIFLKRLSGKYSPICSQKLWLGQVFPSSG